MVAVAVVLKVAVVVLTIVDLPALLGVHAVKIALPKVVPIVVSLPGVRAVKIVLPKVDPIVVSLPGVHAVKALLPRVDRTVVNLPGVHAVMTVLHKVDLIVVSLPGVHAVMTVLHKVVPIVVSLLGVHAVKALLPKVLPSKAEVRLPGMPETLTRPLKVAKEEAHTRSVLLRTILKTLKSVKAALLSGPLTLVPMPLKSVHLPSGAQKARPLVVIVQNPIPLSAPGQPKGLTF
jgi:hypothetical protein